MYYKFENSKILKFQCSIISVFNSPYNLSDVAARNDIREVISKLEGMVSDNEQAVTDDRKAQAEYKCYCDANEEEVTAAIEQGEERTALTSRLINLG